MILAFLRDVGLWITTILLFGLPGLVSAQTIAEAQSKKPRPRSELFRAGIELRGASKRTAQFFRISNILANYDNPGPIKRVLIAPADAARKDREAPVSSEGKREPFGLVTFRAPEGKLWKKWRQVQAEMQAERHVLDRCRKELKECSSNGARFFLTLVGDLKTMSGRTQLEFVNRTVNTAIQYVSDLAHHGVMDKWSTPLATLSSGRGDCEDYAIAKYWALREAGVSADDLRLLIVYDTAIGDDHALLAARHGEHWLLLDDRSKLLADRQATYLRPLFTIDDRGVSVFAAAYVMHPSLEAMPSTIPQRLRMESAPHLDLTRRRMSLRFKAG